LRTEVTPEQARNARVVGAIVAAILALNAIEGMFAPLAGGPAAAWNTLPLVLALGSLVLVRRKPSPRAQGFALLMLLLSVASLSFARWGFSPFTTGLTLVVAGLFAALLVAIIVGVPVAIYRALRWPTEDSEPMELPGDDASLSAELANRITALEAIGFVPRTARRRSDPMGTETSAILIHANDRLLAVAWDLQTTAARSGGTILGALSGAGSGEQVIVTDQPGPDPFPSMPGHRTLRFPGRTAAALQDVVRRLFPPVGLGASMPPPGVEDLLANLSRGSREYRRWLIGQGYLRAQSSNGLHTPTLKGTVVALSRLLWPGRALLRRRARRDAEAALEGR
jgi:hypothetical protein